MVGGNSLFNPDVTEMATCADTAGPAHGHPRHRGPGQRRQRAVRQEHVHRSRASPRSAPPTAGALRQRSSPRSSAGRRTTRPSSPTSSGSSWCRATCPRRRSRPPTNRRPGRGRRRLDRRPKVSGRDEQSAYTPRVQAAKNGNVTTSTTARTTSPWSTCAGRRRPRASTASRSGPARWPATRTSSRRAAPTSTAPTSGCSSCRSRRRAPTPRARQLPRPS